MGMALLKTAVGAGLSMLGKQLAEPPAPQHPPASSTVAPSKININLTVNSSKSATAATGTAVAGTGVSAAGKPASTAGNDNAQQAKEAATAVASRLGGYFRTFTTKLREEAAASAAASAAKESNAPAAAATSGSGPAVNPAGSATSAAATAQSATSKFSFKLSAPASAVLQSPSLRVFGGALLNMLDDSMARAGAAPAGHTAGSTGSTAHTAGDGSGASGSGQLNIVASSTTSRSAPAAPSRADVVGQPGAGRSTGQGETEGQDGQQPDAGTSAAQDQELHRLVAPGEVFLIERKDAPAAGSQPVYRLIACERDSASQQLRRLMIRKSAVKDHFLKGYIEALTALQQGR